jgi:hypothetical protein
LDIAEESTTIYIANNIELFQTKRFSRLSCAGISKLCFVFYYTDVVDGKYCCEEMFVIAMQPKKLSLSQIFSILFVLFPYSSLILSSHYSGFFAGHQKYPSVLK